MIDDDPHNRPTELTSGDADPHNSPTDLGSGSDDPHTGPTELVSEEQRASTAQQLSQGDLQSGAQVGRYRILQKLGQGGMGAVYEAEQTEPVQRRVALKVIKVGFDGEEVIARFESERQALALMDHPSIARVLDGGATNTGSPYFVMEYVKGVPVTEYANTQKLDIRARLALFVRICEGVQHAHQKGIIHRDLKPANVLVTVREDEPEPKIIDFGVAKATAQKLTDMAVHTELGQVVGTPAYMSPEQAEMTALDIDTRSDVYSLGVMLYELLVGTLPIDPAEMAGVPYDEIRRRMREDDPPVPSSRSTMLGERADAIATQRAASLPGLTKRLHGDLDWIVMKALEKDRTRRYPSASELAADIERHLTDQPVSAGPPSTRYRLEKFVARHRTGVALGAVAATVLFAFLIAVTVQSVRLARERDRVQLAQQAAEENLRLAQEAVDEALTELGSEELANVPQMAPVRRRILEKARAFYLEFQDRESSDPDLLMEPALAHRRLGDIYRLESDLDAADDQYATAIEMLAGLTADHPERNDYSAELAHTYNMRGELLRAYPERRADAESAYTSALEQQRGLIDRLDGEALPDGRDPRVALARTFNNRGILLHDAGEIEAAEESYREAVDALESVSRGNAGGGNEHLLELSRVYNNLGALYDETGRVDEARTSFERVIAHLETLSTLDPASRLYRLELSRASNNLAYLLYGNGVDLGRAQDANDRALAAVNDLARPIPDISAEHAHSLWVRGVILRERGSAAAAASAFQSSIEAYREITATGTDFAGSGVFHLRFAWVRWIESPISASALAGLSRGELSGACGDYAWLATELAPEEVKGVLQPADFAAASDVLSGCAELLQSTGNGGRAQGGASRYEDAQRALASKFEG